VDSLIDWPTLGLRLGGGIDWAPDTPSIYSSTTTHSGMASSSTSAAGLTKPHLTYGEFPLASVARLLSQLPLGPDDVFVDLGSGGGRLVLGVSMLWPQLRACMGMELLPELHALAVEVRAREYR
jgi:hypothetical protein